MPCAYCGEETHTAPICFKRLRAEVSMPEVLERYGVEIVKLRTQCPLPGHQGERKNKPFSVKEDGRAFHCWSCGAKGNVIEFVRLMEGLDKASDAGKKLAEWFPANGTAVKSEKKPEVQQAQTPVQEKPGRNIPLAEKFRDKGWDGSLKLDPAHPYLASRGFSTELCESFGVGYCARGMMAGRIAFPIHNVAGELVGYAGRLTDDKAAWRPKDAGAEWEPPRWQFPDGFHRSWELFNLHRAERPHVYVVESFWGVLSLARIGSTSAVALMGRSMSDEQVTLLHSFERVTYLADPGGPGEEAGREIGARLLHGPWRSVRVVFLPKQPDELTPDELRSLLF